jgi:adenosine deaminase
MRDLLTLQKGHLHLHLELAMRPDTLRDLSAAHGLDAPPTRGFDDFNGFIAIVEGALATLRTREDFERLVDEVVEDQARDGVTYFEPSFWPYAYVGPELGRAEDIWEIVLAAGAAAAERHGVCVRFMAAVDRVCDDPAQAVEVAKLAVRYRDEGIVSIGLHNDEVGHPPEPFADAFALALDAGLLSTPHAGELDGPASVRGAIDALSAHRLQHGIRCIEDPALVEELVARGTCLDVCPTSNVALSVVPSLAEHPLPALLAAGVRCSINADDPLAFGPGCLEEYELCRRDLGLTDEQLASCARASIECGAAPADVRTKALAGIDAWLAS